VAKPVPYEFSEKESAALLAAGSLIASYLQ
jgi:hypothetical protein